jgi:lysophospholipase L1-like esterase
MFCTQSVRFSIAMMALLMGVAARAAPPVQYVAMGSSYAAGPGILPMVPGSPLRCARAADNYAHVLARAHGLSLIDVTCSGATTVDVLHAGQFEQPAQVDAVTPETRLVTVTIGGNDVFFMANLIALSCNNAPVKGTGCAPVRPEAEVDARFAHLEDSLREVVAQIHSRSPKARIVFVNYFTVLPDHGTCERAQLTAAEADHMRGIAARLADITGKVARETGSGLLDLAALSHGHDACSMDPWLLGANREPGSFIPPFHPTRAAMRAVGDALNAYPDLMQ